MKSTIKSAQPINRDEIRAKYGCFRVRVLQTNAIYFADGAMNEGEATHVAQSIHDITHQDTVIEYSADGCEPWKTW